SSRYYAFADSRVLISFPTRRSSDLGLCYFNRVFIDKRSNAFIGVNLIFLKQECNTRCILRNDFIFTLDHYLYVNLQVTQPDAVRSEEHTSELQSRENLVCRLLLDKK